MRKIFTFIAALAATLCLSAKETTLWTGNEPISWNPEVYQGSQFETPEGIFTGLQKDYIIKVSVTAALDEPQYVLTYKAGDSWEWTDLTTTVEDGTMSYTVASGQIATEIADRGLIFRGQGYNITAIIVDDNQPDEPEQPEPLQPGEEKVLWSGSETLAWNEVAQQDSMTATLLGEKDQLIVTVADKGSAEWPKVLLRDKASNQVGDDILLSDIEDFPYNAMFTLTAANVEAMQGGFKLCGDGVTVTRLVLKKYKEEEQPVVPAEEYTDTEVWSGDVAISWNPEAYQGTELDTYSIRQDMLAGIAKDDSLKIYYAEAIEDAQFALTYKAGDEWTWTDLTVTNHEGFFAYKVASDEIAQDIADHGLVIRGQGYHAIRIVIGKPQSTEAIEDVSEDTLPSAKVLKNGVLYIRYNGQLFDVRGQRIRL